VAGSIATRPPPQTAATFTLPRDFDPVERVSSRPNRCEGLGEGMTILAPFDAYRDVVREAWVDHNDHMNMGYYMVVFDLATDAWLAYVGLDDAHRRRHNITTFSLEGHITYDREVRGGDRLRFTTQLIDFDQKRIHYIHHMYHDADRYLASTNELMTLHISRETRRSAPMHESVLAHLAEIKAAHVELVLPPQVGRTIGLKSKRAAG
jgi:acyl-CoA thioester hydrolase